MKEIWIIDNGRGSYTTIWTQEAATEAAAFGTKVIRMVPAVEPKMYICCYRTVTTYTSNGHFGHCHHGIIFDEQGNRYDIVCSNTLDGLQARLMERARSYRGYEIIDYVDKPLPGHVVELLARAKPGGLGAGHGMV